MRSRVYSLFGPELVVLVLAFGWGKVIAEDGARGGGAWYDWHMKSPLRAHKLLS